MHEPLGAGTKNLSDDQVKRHTVSVQQLALYLLDDQQRPEHVIPELE